MCSPKELMCPQGVNVQPVSSCLAAILPIGSGAGADGRRQ